MSEYILKIVENPNPKDPVDTEKGWGPWDPVTRKFLKEEGEKEQDYEAWLRKHFVEVERVKDYWTPREGTCVWVSKTKRRKIKIEQRINRL